MAPTATPEAFPIDPLESAFIELAKPNTIDILAPLKPRCFDCGSPDVLYGRCRICEAEWQRSQHAQLRGGR
jgi:hypothetical protein